MTLAEVTKNIGDPETYVGPEDLGRTYMVIGEAPGADEVRLKRPFVGRAGQLLDRLLDDSGVGRHNCYITNVCKNRPALNKFKEFRTKEAGDYLENSIRELWREINEVNPKAIICLGAEAQAAVLGDRRIGARRGFIETVGSWKVISTYHPAAVLREINLYPISLFDLKKIKGEVQRPSPLKDWSIDVKPKLADVISFFTACRESLGFTFDIENTDQGIDCISFALEGRALTVPFQVETGEGESAHVGNYWSKEEELLVWKEIKELLEGPTPKCAQNAFYDCWHIERQMGIRTVVVVHDTMLAAALINSEFPKNLWFLASLYCNVPFWEDKHERLGEDRWRYCAKDSLITYEIWRKQIDELKQLGLTDFFSKLPMSLLPHLVRASLQGVRFDHEKRDLLLGEATAELRDQIRRFKEIAGDINHRSHPQLCAYFIQKRGIKPILDKETKQPTFAAEALERLRKLYDIPEAESLIKIRRIENTINLYKTKLGDDGRLRCSYNIAGTETGRLSSSEAPDRTGTNLQNWSAKNRILIRADEGHIFLKCDLAQAENRIVAYLAEDPFMIEAVSSGDIHTSIAQMIFQDKTIDKKDRRRQLGKKIGHASNYGMGYRRLQEICYEEEGLEISAAEAKAYQRDYFAAFPRILIWHKAIQSQLGLGRRLSNPLGRVRTFLGFWGDSLFKEAYAFLPQSTVVDACNTALVQLGSMGFDIRLQTHDEILFSIREEALHEGARTIKEVMQQPIAIGKHQVQIPVDMSIGSNWYETKEYKEIEIEKELTASPSTPT